MIVMVKTSKTMLNNTGESGHLYLIPDLKGNAFSFSPLIIIFSVGLLYMACFRFKYVASEEGMATHSSILAWRIPMDRRVCWATVYEVTESWTQLSTA